ncbi:hypothetical protein FRC09_003873 [Ceratobasidium sp. 395]|nr:hypothetical protein FRC09_003873 [Ceratobasidium sp. 395]
MSRRSPSPSIIQSVMHGLGMGHPASPRQPESPPAPHPEFRLPSESRHGEFRSSSPIDLRHLIEDAQAHFHSMSRHRSESWHKRVYGGLTDAATLMAAEIGAAAGFEAWRRFNYRNGIIIDHDRERQIRSLVEMAVHEVEEWWGRTGRHMDEHGKREALLAAAGGDTNTIKSIVPVAAPASTDAPPLSPTALAATADAKTPATRAVAVAVAAPTATVVITVAASMGAVVNIITRKANSLAAWIGSFATREPVVNTVVAASTVDAASMAAGASTAVEVIMVVGANMDADAVNTVAGANMVETMMGITIATGYRDPSPSLLSTALPALEAAERYRRHRANSASGRIVPLEGLMGELALGSTSHRPYRRDDGYDYPRPEHEYYRPRSRERDYYNPRRDHDYDRHYDNDDYGRRRGRKHSGAKVIRAISGDPNSEFGHLPPGTYMLDGGSSSGKSRKKRKNPMDYLLGSRA